jgi:hypothetical protein
MNKEARVTFLKIILEFFEVKTRKPQSEYRAFSPDPLYETGWITARDT